MHSLHLFLPSPVAKLDLPSMDSKKLIIPEQVHAGPRKKKAA
jgi:hypothetical protein